MMCQNVELPSAICHNTFQHVCRTLVSILAEYFRRTLLNILHKFGAEHFFFFFFYLAFLKRRAEVWGMI